MTEDMLAKLDKYQNSDRKQWELQIIETADKIPLLQSDWINSQEFDRFIDAWYDLWNFYRFHTEKDMNVEVFGTYRDFTRLLRQVITEEKIDPHFRQAAQDHLDSLESVAEQIVADVVTNLENQV